MAICSLKSGPSGSQSSVFSATEIASTSCVVLTLVDCPTNDTCPSASIQRNGMLRGCARGSDDAGLQHRPQVIAHRPMLDDHPIGEAKPVRVVELDMLAGRPDGSEVSGLCSRHLDPRHDVVALCDEHLDFGSEVGNRRAKPLLLLPRSSPTGAYCPLRRCGATRLSYRDRSGGSYGFGFTRLRIVSSGVGRRCSQPAWKDHMAMTITTTTLERVTDDVFSDLELRTLAGFLGGYSGLTGDAYALDLRQFAQWCHDRHIAVFAVARGDIEALARNLEDRGRVRATISGRLCTIACLYKYAVEEGLRDQPPTVHVRRPRLDYQSNATGLDHNEVSAMLVAAGLAVARDHALIP